MSTLKEFKEFYLKVVLPNTNSYKNFFNESNFDNNIEQLINVFKESYGKNPFEVKSSLEIKDLIAQKKEPFFSYSQKKGSDVPQSIINKHFSLFIDYNKQIYFTDLQQLINELHQMFGNIFIKNFQRERINQNGNSRIASSSEIFGSVRDDYWTINIGGEREIQYHIYKDRDNIGYGIGFNTQKSMNNLSPMENVTPFITSFFLNKSKVDSLLYDYSFGNRSIQDLKNIKEGEFILFGKRFEIELNAKGFTIPGLLLLEMLYDMKNRQFEIYKSIFNDSNNAKHNLHQIFNTMEHTNLLKYKKQIILQGPPGTGKTRVAKEIAEKLLSINQINEDFFKENLKAPFEFKPIGFERNYKPLHIKLITDDTIQFKGENSISDFSFTFPELFDFYQTGQWKKSEFMEYKDYAKKATIMYLLELKKSSTLNNQLKLIQFHPSYTYEDFVRGIVAESKGDGIEYKNVNKTLGLFAKEALANFKSSTSDSPEANLEAWIDEKFESFKNEIDAKLPEDQIVLSGDITIFEVTDSHFKYAEKWKTPGYLKFVEFKKLIKAVLQNELELSNKQHDKDKFIHAHYRYTYYNALLKLFFDQYTYEKETIKVEPKNYVLIIDEINRANLSSVLGELIYALEYRGEEVESMYKVEESQKLILPPNLYIIGTMNTADRSVGHIDYAIRRRFAFVEILPKDLTPEMKEDEFYTDLFFAVKALFTTDDYKTKSDFISQEFEPKDVALGHSYFIDKTVDGGTEKIRWEYEIKPILIEYVRDGVLKQSALDKIQEIEANL